MENGQQPSAPEDYIEVVKNKSGNRTGENEKGKKDDSTIVRF
mgnify:CR=1 FL=1